jgi:DNA repair protein RecO (recombination protein O)
LLSSRVYRAEVLILRRRSLGETDKVVTLLSREHGKLSAVAKGARRPTSRIAGATEAFSYCSVLLAMGQNLDIITQCEVKDSFFGMRGDLNRFAAASYLAELTDVILEERLPAPGIFDLLLSSLSAIQSGRDPMTVVRTFELHSARELGYEPALSRCVRCHNSLTAPAAGFSPALGGVVCRGCLTQVKDAEKVTPGVMAAAAHLLSLSLPRAIESPPNRSELAALGRLMRRHIEYRTERRVKAAEFMEALSATTQ